MDQGKVAKSFQISNTKIITVTKTYDPNNEFDEEYFEFGLFMSRREYKTINRRLQRGRILACQDGKYVGSVTPYGYNKAPIQGDRGFYLVPNEEAQNVKLIFNLYTNSEFGVTKLKEKLDLSGAKSKRGKDFSCETIKQILKNPVYIGKIVWNGRKTVKKYVDGEITITRPRNPDFEVYDGLHEPIIEEHIWENAQKKLKQNTGKRAKYETDIKNPMAGLVICGKCGAKMQRRPYKKSGQETSLICMNAKCDNISSKIVLVEEQLIKMLKEYYKNVKIMVEDNNVQNESEIILNKTIISQLEKEKNSLEIQKEKCCEFLEKEIYDVITFKTRTTDICGKLDVVNKKIKDINSLNKKIEDNKEELTQKLPKLISMIDEYYNLESVKDKNKLLKQLLKKVIYYKDEKAIKKDVDPCVFVLEIYPYMDEKC